MQLTLWVLLTAAVVNANEIQERRSKLPYVADALGNTLPPPSNVPASVGSPVNLLTPDRYEFYTFDESGELVKRLMTLEEIQAIVAAGEETEGGLVTFANDNQPTMAFNFSQPPHTKVHSVVTNVQNVLKAQMEAHKNKPNMQPTLDTPDVSDSWSMILPSIFGNTGLDITPDKTTGSYITPETETIDIDRPMDDDNLLGKEGNNQLLSSSTQTAVVKLDVSSTTTTPSTSKPTISTTDKPATTTRISKPTLTTVKKNNSSTTKPKIAVSTTTTKRPTSKPTLKDDNKNKQQKPNVTNINKTALPESLPTKTTTSTTNGYIVSTKNSGIIPVSKDNSQQTLMNLEESTERGDIQYERVSTIIPISTVSSLPERSTRKPTEETKTSSNFGITTKNYVYSTYSTIQPPAPSKPPKMQVTTSLPKLTSQIADSSIYENDEINNSTTITTQSVSPSTTTTYTQSMPFNNAISQNGANIQDHNINVDNDSIDLKEDEPKLPLFDVAQSISQIASDLGDSHTSVTSSDNSSNNATQNSVDLESKENVEMDIPAENDDTNNADNYVKVSTLDPRDKTVNSTTIPKISNENIKANGTNTQASTTKFSEILTTLDPVLSESMGDLLTQVVNETPGNYVDNEPLLQKEVETFTTVLTTEVVNTEEYSEVTTETLVKEDILTSNDINPIGIITSNKKENSYINQNNSMEVPSENNEDNTLKTSTIASIIFKDEDILTTTTKEPTADFKENLKFSGLKTIVKTPSNIQQAVDLDNTNNNKSVNSTLPSYKSEIHLNDSNSLEENAYTNQQIKLTENEEHKEKEQNILPKVEEFKKKIQKVNIDDKELGSDRNNSWKLIPTVSPSKTYDNTKLTKDKQQTDTYNYQETNSDKKIVLDFSKENQGLELTSKDLGEDIAQFAELCNELAFRYWNDIIENVDKKRSFVFSPYAITSMLAMMFMGARGATSGEMNDILKLDDMVTFNPHFTLKNISDSIEINPASGVAVSAFIRELYSDRAKGKILTFYKERAQHFYNGHVEEVNFKLISDIVRRRTNLLVKRYTWGKLLEYIKTNTIVMQPPLAAFSANIFYTDCTGTSVDGRDGEMYFVVSPNVRQRRLVPVPAVAYKNNFLAGYDPVLDVTAAALGNTNSMVSTIFVMPGQQGNIVHAEDLEDLEKRLLESNPTTPAWNRLLRTLLPRVGLELQIPRFFHESVFNVSSTLKRMGLKDIFDPEHADLGGMNGPSKDLYLSDMIQSNTFATCGESVIAEQHHKEQYPELEKRRSARWITGWDEPRDYQRAFHDPHDVGEAMHLPLHLRPRQARLPSRNAQPARLKFDRPFLFFVRHNLSGMILYVGRYNPRLLP